MELLNGNFSRRRAAKSILTAGAAGLAAATLVKAEPPQVHMQAALRALGNAATQLQAAEEDKAGHRAKALQLVNEAITQVKEGIAAGAK
ncbi:MAG TPA: hypothetical protein VME43_33615 [Bryobacteraceae bacterium]|nr:hypothetical protein [Bryobacteraceae bacterium]